MTSETLSVVPPKRKNFWHRIGPWLRSNPVVMKELRGRMRGRRAFVNLTVYLALVAVFIGIAYGIFWASNAISYGMGVSTPTVAVRQGFGKTIFAVVIGLEMLWACIVSPALTAQGISSEREHQTFDLLRTTLLSPRDLVLGKFLSGFVFVLLILLATLPLQSIAFLFGGVSPEEMLLCTLVIVVTSAGFSALGVFCSSLFKRSPAATGLTFGITIFWTVVLPVIVFIWFGTASYSVSRLAPESQSTLLIVGWLMLSLNPAATLIATESLLVQNQTAWAYTTSVTSSLKLTLISPWFLYVVLSVIVTILLLTLSAILVRRPEK